MFSLFRLCRKNRSTCSIWQCCFDIVADVDGALVMTSIMLIGRRIFLLLPTACRPTVPTTEKRLPLRSRSAGSKKLNGPGPGQRAICGRWMTGLSATSAANIGPSSNNRGCRCDACKVTRIPQFMLVPGWRELTPRTEAETTVGIKFVNQCTVYCQTVSNTFAL